MVSVSGIRPDIRQGKSGMRLDIRSAVYSVHPYFVLELSCALKKKKHYKNFQQFCKMPVPVQMTRTFNTQKTTWFLKQKLTR
jgi:hypothetical protein